MALEIIYTKSNQHISRDLKLQFEEKTDIYTYIYKILGLVKSRAYVNFLSDSYGSLNAYHPYVSLMKPYNLLVGHNYIEENSPGYNKKLVDKLIESLNSEFSSYGIWSSFNPSRWYLESISLIHPMEWKKLSSDIEIWLHHYQSNNNDPLNHVNRIKTVSRCYKELNIEYFSYENIYTDIEEIMNVCKISNINCNTFDASIRNKFSYKDLIILSKDLDIKELNSIYNNIIKDGEDINAKASIIIINQCAGILSGYLYQPESLFERIYNKIFSK